MSGAESESPAFVRSSHWLLLQEQELALCFPVAEQTEVKGERPAALDTPGGLSLLCFRSLGQGLSTRALLPPSRRPHWSPMVFQWKLKLKS